MHIRDLSWQSSFPFFWELNCRGKIWKIVAFPWPFPHCRHFSCFFQPQFPSFLFFSRRCVPSQQQLVEEEVSSIGWIQEVGGWSCWSFWPLCSFRCLQWWKVSILHIATSINFALVEWCRSRDLKMAFDPLYNPATIEDEDHHHPSPRLRVLLTPTRDNLALLFQSKNFWYFLIESCNLHFGAELRAPGDQLFKLTDWVAVSGLSYCAVPRSTY